MLPETRLTYLPLVVYYRSNCFGFHVGLVVFESQATHGPADAVGKSSILVS